MLCILIADRQWSPLWALFAALGMGAVIGLINGILVTELHCKLSSSPCVACSFIAARRSSSPGKHKSISGTHPKWEIFVTGGWWELPVTLWILILLALVATVFLHLSVAGRYFYALGSNETAAPSPASRSTFTRSLPMCCVRHWLGFTAFWPLKFPSVTPSNTGSFDELYAIAGAVLGGCSLRGGEGTIPGFLIGTAILIILNSMGVFWKISDQWNGILIGSILLLGTILDEVLRAAAPSAALTGRASSYKSRVSRVGSVSFFHLGVAP